MKKQQHIIAEFNPIDLYIRNHSRAEKILSDSQINMVSISALTAIG